jgi:flagella basal body P-ring formation protein FlgA
MRITWGAAAACRGAASKGLFRRVCISLSARGTDVFRAAIDGTRLAFYRGMERKHRRTAWIPALLLPGLGFAQPLQAPADIQKIFASADALDPRLRLPACSQRPTGLMPSAARVGARVTVGVKCGVPRWTVYVPVRVETELPVLVLRRALDRNSPLTEADVERRTLRVPGLSASYISSVEQLAGRHLRREAAPGTPLTIDLLAEDVLVRHGQRVTLVASIGGLEVHAQGEAVTDAGPTGRVRVLNLSSRRIVEGQVESREVVRVGL